MSEKCDKLAEKLRQHAATKAQELCKLFNAAERVVEAVERYCHGPESSFSPSFKAYHTMSNALDAYRAAQGEKEVRGVAPPGTVFTAPPLTHSFDHWKDCVRYMMKGFEKASGIHKVKPSPTIPPIPPMKGLTPELKAQTIERWERKMGCDTDWETTGCGFCDAVKRVCEKCTLFNVVIDDIKICSHANRGKKSHYWNISCDGQLPNRHDEIVFAAIQATPVECVNQAAPTHPFCKPCKRKCPAYQAVSNG